MQNAKRPSRWARWRRTRRTVLILLLLLAASSCAQSDDDDSSETLDYGENPEFTDPTTWLFGHFDSASEAELAYALRALEGSIERTVDFESPELIDRSPAVEAITTEELKGVLLPDADPASCQAVTLAARSTHPIHRHALGALQSDQSPGDPSTPDHKARTFRDETELCWGDWQCAALRAEDSMTRVTSLLTVSLTERIDYRWVDLGLPSPSKVPIGIEPLNEGTARWAIVMRSWLPETASNEDGTATFRQAYALGTWFAQEGNPLLPTLRYTASWTETLLPVPLDDSTVRQLSRGALAEAYESQEIWLGTLP